MRALQRLQQKILATDEGLVRNFDLTPRAHRLHDSLKRQAYIGIGIATLSGAVALNVVGGDYDPSKLYLGEVQSAQVKRNLYDKHLELLVANEVANGIKRAMMEAESTAEVTALSKDFKAARKRVDALKLDFEVLAQDQDPAVLHDLGIDKEQGVSARPTSKLRG